MKASYDIATDSLYIHLKDRTSVASDEVIDGVVLDFDARGAVVGMDMQHACKHLGSDNVFRDLGFPEAEAQNLLLRTDLVIHIRKAIAKMGLAQAEAAKRAGITQPRMNDWVKGRTHKFTLDALVNVAAQLGYTGKLTRKKAA